MYKNQFVLILAGGVGSRFWPKSTTRLPKQFQDILGTGSSLLQMTYNRALRFVPEENILISTQDSYRDLVRKQLPNVSERNILMEPARRNTAPAIAYGMSKIARRDDQASVMVCPSDHLILSEDIFADRAIEILEYVKDTNRIVTLGITPNKPHTGYGYIQFVDGKDESGISKVKTFTEKPSEDIARSFLESGDFLWNAGIFFWSVKTFFGEIKKHIPELFEAFTENQTVLDTDEELPLVKSFYPRLENESIDFALLEKSKNVFVAPMDIGWSDLGAWGALHGQVARDKNDNALVGKKILTYESNGNIVHVSGDKIAVVEGLNDYIVVDTPHALLICRKESEQKVRDFVKDVKLIEGDRFV
ncbi:MAG: mannose-1-phosphate guanylyltransferase [Cryomorphaceae bacterium]|nr:mannose-1-phosphate guanylyltransferase [Cryomorphaceae bacterium]